MIFFYEGTELEDKTLFKVLMAASLGNLGSSNPVCQAGVFNTPPKSSGKSEAEVLLKLSCPFGELYSLTEFGQLSVNDLVDCKATRKRSGETSFEYFPSACHIDHPESKQAF